jgi:hypothetical protein
MKDQQRKRNKTEFVIGVMNRFFLFIYQVIAQSAGDGKI